MQYINELIEKDIGRDVEKAEKVRKEVFNDSFGMFCIATVLMAGICGIFMLCTFMDETALSNMKYEDMKVLGIGFVSIVLGLAIGITISRIGIYDIADKVIQRDRTFRNLIKNGYKEEDYKEDSDGRDE